MKKKILYMAVMLLLLNISGCEKSNAPKESSHSIPVTEIQTSTVEETAPIYQTSDRKLVEGAVISTIKSKEDIAEHITQQEIDQMVEKILYETDEFESLIQNGQTVVIKPNLVQMYVDSTGDLLDKTVNGVTTDWRVTNAVVNQVRKLNPDGTIYIMEGSASGPTSKVMAYYNYTSEFIKEADGFFSLEEDMGGWQEFDSPEIVKVNCENGLLHKEYYFSRKIYEADVLISIPCLKTSSGVVVTAGIKNVSLGTPPGNIYGESPDNPSKTKMVSHKIKDGELDKWIYDYFICRPIDYVVVDGLQGFQSGPVPMSGKRKETDKMNMGVLLAGRDAVAVDTICALITGWDPESVGYLNLFKENERGISDPAGIRVFGSQVDQLRTNFTIKRPDLGGVQITDQEGPGLEIISCQFAGEKLIIDIQTDDDAVKAELYLDGYFYEMQAAKPGGTMIFEADMPFPGEEFEVCVVVYDRFLNRTEANTKVIPWISK